ncbi:MAG: tetratricopeptide repeat protein [Verrucomicrobia bacterium]|nr:tetratricopeptide repeat protein [Verrucomicrobiota bacterium]
MDFVKHITVTVVTLAALGCSSEKREASSTTAQSSVEPALEACSIIINKCSTCHMKGGSAPFSLTTYEEIKKRGSAIAEVTSSRYMPPWLAQETTHAFVDDKSLSKSEIQLIREWVESGMIKPISGFEGLVSTNNIVEWKLGPPDLVLEMKSAYEMPVESDDIYWHFVIPSGLKADRYVKGFDFKPDNNRIVHHAFIKIDKTNSSRRLDEAGGGVGFDGMVSEGNAVMPDGHFTSWQQGREPKLMEKGASWLLPANSDVVFQLHMKSTGKKERIKSKIGLYFADEKPTKYFKKINLTRRDFKIPANEKAFKLRESFTLAEPAHLRAVMPHAHYLGKAIDAKIIYPDGRVENVLHIPNWDPAWQSEYVFKDPIPLPRGATLIGEISYDNSKDNYRNPNPNPIEVSYGTTIKDEMFEVAFQLFTNQQTQLDKISGQIDEYNKNVFLNATKFQIEQDPNNADEWCFLGQVYLSNGAYSQAYKSLKKSIDLDPDNAKSYYYLGLYYRFTEDPSRAEYNFIKAIKIDNNNAKAHGNLGFIYIEKKRYNKSKLHFQRALEINPHDEIARKKIQALERNGF